jgi:5-methylcytosine-specific restriction protein A
VLSRDAFTCQRCGLYDRSGKQLRACHIVPVAAGGSYDPSNGITRCKPCDKATDPHAR